MRLAACLLVLLSLRVQAAPNHRNTEWFKAAGYGVFMHFLPADATGLARVHEFDVQNLARQLETLGAKYFVITLGQNSGFFNSPNATYDRYTGYAPGQRCSPRDLPLDLYRALTPKGIRLMLYLPCQTPNQDARAQKAFGLRQGAQDQPIDLEFARKWAQVIQEWSDRYGDKVAGWWFDGGYEHIHFNEAIARVYAAAVKHGNPDAIVTFNPGVRLIRWTQAEDYTAGELNEPFDMVPASPWVNGSQWHALTYLGSNWSRRDTRYPAERWAKWVRTVVSNGGVVTLDMGPNWDPASGPIGALAQAQMDQVRAIQAALRTASVGSYPNRLTRAESFLGIHFDFHAGADCNAIGKNTTREMIENVVNQVHPDYVQIDCKGHPGLSSYPTKIGNQAPGFVGDPLRLWRQVTAERGVALYMHYSGVWDSEAVRRHPEWAAVDADGKTSDRITSRFGPYVDQLLIPQLRELAGDYGVDGAWIDGDCWASVPDYSEPALKAFRQRTGIDDVPRKPGDPHWFGFLQFHREAFREYVRHYIAEVKKTNPDFQLCSNWAFTDHMPEPVSAPVDFLSGDYSPDDSVNSARLSGRYLTRQGKPWDLMAWSFSRSKSKDGRNQKTAIQLQREAAVVLALGGGFQAYFTQKRDGSIREERVPVMAEVARFCRARQAICHRAMAVPQVALLFSTAAHYRKSNGLFARDLARISGALRALLEGQQSVEILGEHHLAGRMADYPLIVVPEWEYLEPKFKDELVAYVKGGGNLLLIGPGTAAMFQTQLDVIPEGEPAPAADWRLAYNGELGEVTGTKQLVKLGPSCEPFGRLQRTGETGASSQPAASVREFGRGKIAAMYFTFGQGYVNARTDLMRQFLNGLVRRLFPRPMVEVKGSPDVDVVVNRQDGKLAVNLVNTAGPHQHEPILDVIPPVGPLDVTIRHATKPTRIMLEPAGSPLSFEHRNGEIYLVVPRVDIHEVIVVEPD
ncbi:MAG: alpha-L-fucosidase [Sedimentisphaerales bacterium]|nr:alpha-L-fucosidase [Sedimentisphaerales bacterium]